MSNTVHPIMDSPVTSQPSSSGHGRLHPKNQLKPKEGEIVLPTPRRFLTPEDTPPGLSSLVEPQYVFMKQSFRNFDGHPEDSCKYEVLNIYGTRIFMAVEKTDAAMNKIFCAGAAPFALRIFSKTSETHFRKEVLQIGGHPGSFGCGAEILVKYDNKKLGHVEQEGDCSTIRYTVQNAEGDEVLKIHGPNTGSCWKNCCGSMGGKFPPLYEFDIYLSDGTHVGRIAKHWSGFPSNSTKEIFTRSDIWGVKFPQEYDVRLKVLLLASVFLMAYQFSDK